MVGRVASRSRTVTFKFKEGNFPRMRGWGKGNLKERTKRLKSFREAWRIFKTTVMESS